MTNNDILKKLRVALKLKDEDIVKILALVDYQTNTSELGALFRKEDHPKYMPCGDQLLRNFLNGLIIHLRGPKHGEPNKVKAEPADQEDKIVQEKIKPKTEPLKHKNLKFVPPSKP